MLFRSIGMCMLRIGKSSGRKGKTLPSSETYYRLDKKPVLNLFAVIKL